MVKLTNKMRRELELIQIDLLRAFEYVRKDSTAICRKGGVATTTLHMTRQMDGAVFYEVNKEIGSNLIGLEEGLRKLARLLAPEVEEVA
jgi:hypothetical protein